MLRKGVKHPESCVKAKIDKLFNIHPSCIYMIYQAQLVRSTEHVHASQGLLPFRMLLSTQLELR